MILGLVLTAAVMVEEPVQSAAPALPAAVECLDPARRDAILAGKAFPMPSTADINAYNQQRGAALDARMDRLGMDAQAKSDFARRVMKSPEFAAAFKAGLDGLTAMMKDVGQMSRSRDATVNCRLLLHMAGQLPAMMAGAEIQWRLMERELDAEEARRGGGKPS